MAPLAPTPLQKRGVLFEAAISQVIMPPGWLTGPRRWNLRL